MEKSLLPFKHNYEVELEHSLSGRDPEEVFYYPGASQEGGRDGVMVKIIPNNSSAWFGVFAGGAGGGVYSCPKNNQLCVRSGNTAYLVEADNPLRWEELAMVSQVVQVPGDGGLLLFVDNIKIIAYGEDGLMWRSKDMGFGDDLKIIKVDKEEGIIYGQYFDPTNSIKPIVSFRLLLEAAEYSTI